ncbi:MAG: PaaI family thioesterase [Oligoflexales bacterium]
MKEVTVEQLNQQYLGPMATSFGVKITALAKGRIEGTMPVTQKCFQPLGIVHGAAYCLLGETLGSVASYVMAAPNEKIVGTSLTTNYMRKVDTGTLHARAVAKHLGRRTQVWQIEITDDADKLVSHMTLQTMIL